MLPLVRGSRLGDRASLSELDPCLFAASYQKDITHIVCRIKDLLLIIFIIALRYVFLEQKLNTTTTPANKSSTRAAHLVKTTGLYNQ